MNLPVGLDLKVNIPYRAKINLLNISDEFDHLLLRSSMQDMTVYLENDIIYEHEIINETKLVAPPPSLWLLVSLPNNYQEKRLTLEIQSDVAAFNRIHFLIHFG